MKPRAAFPLVAVLVTTAGIPAFPQTPSPDKAAISAPAGEPSKDPKIDEAALAILKRASDVIFALDRYQAESWSVLTYPPRADGKTIPQPPREMATLTAVKPNLMRYDQWEMRGPVEAGAEFGTWERKKDNPTYTFVVDGKSAWRQFGENYREDARTQPESLSTILEPWDGFYSTGNSPHGSADQYRQKGELKEARRDGSAVVDGVECEKVFLHALTAYNGESLEFRTTWYVGGKDGLVRRKVEWVEFGGKKGHLRDATLRNIRTNGDVKAEPALFTYSPPKGVTLDKDKPAPPLLASGTLAPDFSATTADGKTVKLSDYKGQVVVLDFWASWCGPCVASMPHNQKVAKKLRDEKLPVTILALDNSEDRDTFLQWVKAHPQLDALLFAHADPQNETDIEGKLYKVSGIPTQYVIDAKGVIRASFVGFGGESDELEKAVRTALKP